MNNSLSNNCKRMKLSLFNATRQDGSNELHSIFLQSLNAKLFNKIVKSNHIKLNFKSNQIKLNSKSS